MKVVYMGTPDFAVGPLESIINAGHEVVLVVTQPDRVRGRSGKVSYSPVKEVALAHNIPVFQPEKIKQEEEVKELAKYPADIFVVAAFGQILSKEILDMPRLGCVNIHASLLPKYRGAAPIQWSIINGDEKSGVTLMKMDVGLDTGDILMQEEIVLDKKETGESLFDKLAKLGSDMIVKALPMIEKGKLTPIPQNDEESNYAKMLTKDYGEIDFVKSATTIERLIRGLNSWPSTYTHINGKVLKIWDADVLPYLGNEKTGSIIGLTKDSFTVKCGEDALKVNEVQLEGKKRMKVEDFLRGFTINVGDTLS